MTHAQETRGRMAGQLISHPGEVTLDRDGTVPSAAGRPNSRSSPMQQPEIPGGIRLELIAPVQS
jgi:hypothetical protein